MPKTPFQGLVFGTMMALAMVCVMCPLMSLVAVFAFMGAGRETAARWAHTFAFNLPMALCWQILIAGPLVRFLFHRLFTAHSPAAIAND